MHETHYSLSPIGLLRSPLKDRGAAPNQGREGAPDAWLVVPRVAQRDSIVEQKRKELTGHVF